MKRPASAVDDESTPPKKRMKKTKGYCLTAEKWNVDAGASKDEKEEALQQYKKMAEASIQEKQELLMEARLFIQRQIRDTEPSQSVEDLSSFWEGGPPIMSDWFEWLVGGSKLGCMAQAASEQMVKVLNIVEDFIISKRGDEFEGEMKHVKDTAVELNGNTTMFQVFLLKDLAKLFKNKPQKIIFVDGKDDKHNGPEDKDPNIFITKQNIYGEDEFEEKIFIHLRIGDKVVWKDVSLPEALAGVIQVYFSFNILYPPDSDDFLQFVERIICNFGSDDGARNKKNMVKKEFRDFQVSFPSIIGLILFNDLQGFAARLLLESNQGQIMNVFV